MLNQTFALTAGTARFCIIGNFFNSFEFVYFNRFKNLFFGYVEAVADNLVGTFCFSAQIYLFPLVGMLELGIKDIEKNLPTFKVAFGRSEVKYLNGKRTLIQLIKNPIGANEVLKTVDLNSDILIAINDNYADGRDVSWLWDADFDLLMKTKNKITVSGTRARDMALRLKYAGVPADKIKIIPDLKKAVDYIGKTADNDITILIK